MDEFKKVCEPTTATFGLYHGEKKTEDEVNILFASFQTIINLLDLFDEDYFEFIIMDECHRGHARTYKKVIDHFMPRCLLGMTATPYRGDMKDIREIFGPEIIDIPLEVGIANGWLTEVDYRVITDNLDEKALEQLIKKSRKSREKITLNEINRRPTD